MRKKSEKLTNTIREIVNWSTENNIMTHPFCNNCNGRTRFQKFSNNKTDGHA